MANWVSLSMSTENKVTGKMAESRLYIELTSTDLFHVDT